MMESDCVEARLTVIIRPRNNRFWGHRRITYIEFNVMEPYCVITKERDGRYGFRKTKHPEDPIHVDIIIQRKTFKKVNIKKVLNEKYYSYEYYSTHVYSSKDAESYIIRISDAHQEFEEPKYVKIVGTYILKASDFKDHGHILRYLLKENKTGN